MTVMMMLPDLPRVQAGIGLGQTTPFGRVTRQDLRLTSLETLNLLLRGVFHTVNAL